MPQSEDTPARPAARLTPYELVFGEGDFESAVFPDIRAEAVDREADARSPERFGFLSVVGDLLREITPEDAAPEALEQYRGLLYHAYHFWAGGRRLYALDRAVSRFLVEAASSKADGSIGPPGESGYVQLPANLFWGSVSNDTPPEPIDGFSYVVTEGEGEGVPPRIHLLLVLGIRRGRAGFSVIGVDGDLDEELVEEIGSRSGNDFENVLPGGEISGLYSILTASEALKLATRVFRYMSAFPDALVEFDGAEPRVEDSEPPATRLAYTAVALRTEGGTTGR